MRPGRTDPFPGRAPRSPARPARVGAGGWATAPGRTRAHLGGEVPSDAHSQRQALRARGLRPRARRLPIPQLPRPLPRSPANQRPPARCAPLSHPQPAPWSPLAEVHPPAPSRPAVCPCVCPAAESVSLRASFRTPVCLCSPAWDPCSQDCSHVLGLSASVSLAEPPSGSPGSLGSPPSICPSVPVWPVPLCCLICPFICLSAHLSSWLLLSLNILFL